MPYIILLVPHLVDFLTQFFLLAKVYRPGTSLWDEIIVMWALHLETDNVYFDFMIRSIGFILIFFSAVAAVSISVV